MLYKLNHLIKTRLHPLSNDCSASPVFISSGLVGQQCCQKSSAMCRCIFTGGRHLRKNNKRALQCARCLTKLKPASSILKFAHIPSPHWSQRRKSHRNAVEITLKKLASVASIRLRGTVMAANRKTHHNNTVSSRHYGRHAIYVPGDVRFQDGDAFDLG